MIDGCRLDHSKQLTAAGNPQVSVALRLLPDLRVRGVLLEHVFKLGRRFPLRAKIAETTPLALITEQGENRNQREKQWNLSAFSHGFACRGT